MSFLKEYVYLCKNYLSETMNTFKLSLLLPFLAVMGVAHAQRNLNYYPDGPAFVCLNGHNKYTRALYGTNTEWRLETSDRPLFASYKKKSYRNISFALKVGDKELPLTQTRYCEARYEAGMRYYTLTDDSWDGGLLTIITFACADREGALWKFSADGFTKPLTLIGRIGDVKSTSFSRNGDLRADKGDFDPSGMSVTTLSCPLRGNVYARLSVQGTEQSLTLSTADSDSIAYENAWDKAEALGKNIMIVTPDAFFNTLGGALTAAADGIWGAETNTWMHGAIGWRMPYNGWRGAFAGDYVGWPDRQNTHFSNYAASQITTVEPVSQAAAQDTAKHLARSVERLGTPLFSNGYIGRFPNDAKRLSHYDMNLNLIDEWLTHLQFNADSSQLRAFWPTLKRHLEWEKRNFDPDDDGLYDAYACIWASDALYYNGGSVTHSSAYNYRAFKLAGRIAELLGEDPTYYNKEAEKTLRAINRTLWLDDAGHWAEYKDYMGLRRVHRNAAIWSIYTPIDCGVGTPDQWYRATQYVDSCIPHIALGPIAVHAGDDMYLKQKLDSLTQGAENLKTISTSGWQPYEWSINNVAPAEVMHMALAYFKAGRAEEGYQLLKASILDNMYLGASPGNFGQISHYDAALGEKYRDFADVVGIGSKALVEGLFGIEPAALYGKCYINYRLPKAWKWALISTPYITVHFKQTDDKLQYTVTQHFAKPLQIVIKAGSETVVGNTDSVQTFFLPVSAIQQQARQVAANVYERPDTLDWGTGLEGILPAKCKEVDLSKAYNAKVSDIFKNRYVSPRPPFTTLEMPVQGVGDWCSWGKTADINDSVFRSLIKDGRFSTPMGLAFRSPKEGSNIVYTSLWDNYPDSMSIPLEGRASRAYLLLAGSTNHMQYDIPNGQIVITYEDGSTDSLMLVNPYNWCPIERDYLNDGKAFKLTVQRPYRVELGTGRVSRTLLADDPNPEPRTLKGGAAEILSMRLNPKKKLRSLTLRALSNDVVIGLMGLTLQK